MRAPYLPTCCRWGKALEARGLASAHAPRCAAVTGIVSTSYGCVLGPEAASQRSSERAGDG